MAFDFLGFRFEPVLLEHRERLGALLARHPQPLSGFTFATLAAWNGLFQYGWTQPSPGSLLISYFGDPGPDRHLLQPIGDLPPELAAALVERAAELPRRLRIVGVSPDFLAQHPDFAGNFVLGESEAGANYLYSAEDLATLAGRRFAKKRNLIAQARKLYDWTVEPLGAAHVPECRAIVDEILTEERPEICPTLEQELAALDYTLAHFGPLGQRGTLVRVDGRAVAFSIWEAIGPKTAVVHFERALRRFKGIYQVINQETARAIVGAGFELINREEDLGDPGLRQAKRSYHPIALVPSLTLCFREDLSRAGLARPGEPPRPCPP